MRRRPLRLVAALAVGAVAATLTFGAVASPAAGDSIDDKRAAAEKEKKQNAAEREAAEDTMEGVNAKIQETSDRLLEIQGQIPDAQVKLDEANAVRDKAQREAKLVADRLQDAKDQKVTLGETITKDTDDATKTRAAIGQMAREAYRTGGAVSGVEVILDSTSTDDFIERYGLMTTALRTQAQVLDDLKTSEATNKSAHVRLEAVEGRITELNDQAQDKLAEAKTAATKAEAARKALDNLVAEQKSKQVSLESQRAAVLAEIAQADAEAKQIQKEINALKSQAKARDAELKRKREEAARKAAAEAAKNGGKPAIKPGHSSSKPLGGALFSNPTSVNPIHVTSEYGMRFHPILHYTRLHAGIDLRTYCNTKVYAGRDGIVMWSKFRFGFGNQVMIDSGTVNGNSLAESYNHLTRGVVHSGQYVERGELIGYSGNTGTSAACHLHFEVYVNGSTVNPRPLLGL
ncbi:peptidoglycan DD-metalloendopeptidase family protein [Cellulomonas sp. PhB150]|uniref:peptidoglycan DD-metalloendopeptidase family protein n=1 Tax=Cellulomonas sp. PhB150 TaxID=2485188 RepID=UPI000F461CB4|nr:peptidoglycan DD-metalloendopeptidase family protein [Cellulomonas sp. PhB150]ROS27819.1 murein DD-endopeptidase MepM/ murein hydrolase activator NlpD [Cellulomonas sp. PhB150]